MPNDNASDSPTLQVSGGPWSLHNPLSQVPAGKIYAVEEQDGTFTEHHVYLATPSLPGGPPLPPGVLQPVGGPRPQGTFREILAPGWDANLPVLYIRTRSARHIGLGPPPPNSAGVHAYARVRVDDSTGRPVGAAHVAPGPVSGTSLQHWVLYEGLLLDAIPGVRWTYETSNLTLDQFFAQQFATLGPNAAAAMLVVDACEHFVFPTLAALADHLHLSD